jgi:hypothetical protein
MESGHSLRPPSQWPAVMLSRQLAIRSVVWAGGVGFSAAERYVDRDLGVAGCLLNQFHSRGEAEFGIGMG